MNSTIRYTFNALLAIGGLAGLLSCGGNSSDRQTLDRYVALETEISLQNHALQPGVSVYVDFSDGMNAAYGTLTSQEVLRKVVNALTDAKKQPDFYSLADSKITPLDLPQTELYNAIMSGKNYTLPKAPIEETLKTIVEKSQSALLITDFEEYNGDKIQQQNYAKTYFIDWLKKGYNITFYKLDYKEKGKDKHLYFTVFDSQENLFGDKIENVLSSYIGNGVDKFVLAGRECSYDLATNYPTSISGGSTHNASGEDIVSAVWEDGKEEAYITYSYNAPDMKGTPFATFKTYYGPLTAYYPFGSEYKDILTNIEATKEEGVDPADRFKHLISKLYVNFNVQNGYSIETLDVNVTDCQPAMLELMERCDTLTQEKPDPSIISGLKEGKKVADMFTVAISPVAIPELQGEGWNEILFDFDDRFKGEIPPTMESSKDLLKADIVISKAIPNNDIDSFFAWPGNNSLSESVRNTLQDPAVNPEGQVIVTYYIKVL
ncbi:MAG: hypothetical protein K2G85_00105 [Muribaculaceae bacterium]|nr:hypothetical protein [Muribaculaceae bacterium]